MFRTLVCAALCLAAGHASAAPRPGTLADALQMLQGKEFVDLTHRFSPASPVWSGFGQATISAVADPKAHAILP